MPRIRVKIGRREQLVPLDEIDCFVAEDGYVMARSAAIEGFVDASLRELEERLGDAVVRVHRSCLVVKEALTGVETRSNAEHWVLFRDYLEAVPVSRRQMPVLRSVLKESENGL